MRLIRHRSSLVVLASLLAASACVNGPTAPGGPSQALTALPRQLTPAEQSVLGAANAFSFALFGTVSAAQPDTNVFLSPLSASMSLGMALNGAANGTYDEMRSALQLGTATQHDINAGYHSLIALLTGLDPAVQLDVANSIWYDRTFPFYQSFLDTTKAYFDADVQPLDFTNQSASLAAINGWVNTKTNGKIPSILDAIQQGDVMYLVNAVYFNAHWRTRFDSAQTQAAPFTPAAGAPQQVMLMHREGTMSYAHTGAYQAVDLAYGDSAFTMTVLLPAPGVGADALADSLTPAFWTALTASLRGSKVDLYLPRMTLSYSRTLNDDLKALGMRSAFVADGADFTRMSSLGTELYVSFVKQKAFVSVDESGTEAAAATVTGIATTAYEPPAVMRVDRPFVFVIRERLSGTILFMAKIASLPGA